MNAPLVINEVISSDHTLLIALLLGIGMGFFLERAGFGSAKKLTAQFYLYDMTVFKVMFTAIITAMVGIYLFSTFGFLDLSQVSFVGTFVWPQILGGLILGIGFVVGGYCPGTSIVAGSTGKLDGFAYLAGIVLGMFSFAEFYPSLEGFLNASALGKQTLYQFFNISYGLAVVLVLLMAGGGFYGATILERKFKNWKPTDQN